MEKTLANPLKWHWVFSFFFMPLGIISSFLDFLRALGIASKAEPVEYISSSSILNSFINVLHNYSKVLPVLCALAIAVALFVGVGQILKYGIYIIFVAVGFDILTTVLYEYPTIFCSFGFNFVRTIIRHFDAQIADGFVIRIVSILGAAAFWGITTWYYIKRSDLSNFKSFLVKLGGIMKNEKNN